MPPHKLADLVREGGEPAPVQEESRQEGGPPQGPDLASRAVLSPPAGVVPGGETEGPLKELHAADPLIQRAAGILEGIFQAVRANAPFSISDAQEAVEELRQSLEASDALLVSFFSGGGPSPNPSWEAVNVSVLSMKMGMELGYAPERVGKLGLAALLSDVGLAYVPAQILGKRGELKPDERAVLESAQGRSAKLFRAQEPEYRWLAEVVESRYEKVKAARHSESETEECAAIIGLADICERLVRHRPFRQALGTLGALKKILLEERATFPDRMFKALIRILSTFPVGSLVLLNTGEIGRVVAKNRDFPLRPVLEVLVRHGKWLKPPMVVDLGRSPLHHIQDSFLEEALP